MATDEQEFVTANNLFAATAYKELLKHQKKNFLASPFSAEIVLTFAQSGCKGETAQEIRTALHLPEDQNKIETGIKKFLPGLEGGDNYKLHCANKLYVQEKFPLKNEFKKAATEVYQAEVDNINFELNQEAVKEMNKWVEDKTNNKIQNLIGPNDVDKLTRVIILNALYFKSCWATEFYLDDTMKSKFYLNARDVVEVDTMYYSLAYKNRFPVCWSKELDARFLALPFRGRNASMIIALPEEREGLPALESQLDKVFASHDFVPVLLDIALPKFKITSQIDFKKILLSLGVKKVFQEEADLSGIAGEKGDLLIDKILQKTFIKVNEKGVEAAAATYAKVCIPLSLMKGPRSSFIVDHPFIFYIKINDAVVFAGRVTNPLL